MGKGHGRGHMLAARKEFQRVAGHAPVGLAVVAAIADHALVVTEAGAIFGKHRAQQVEGQRTGPAQIVAPVKELDAGLLNW